MRADALVVALWATVFLSAHGARGAAAAPAQLLPPPAEPSAVALQADVNAAIARGVARLAPAAKSFPRPPPCSSFVRRIANEMHRVRVKITSPPMARRLRGKMGRAPLLALHRQGSHGP